MENNKQFEKDLCSIILLILFISFAVYWFGDEHGLLFPIIFFTLFSACVIYLIIQRDKDNKNLAELEKQQNIENQKKNLDKLRQQKETKAIQKEYKKRINDYFTETKNNPEVKNILNNFLPQIPSSIYFQKICYTYFEYLIREKYEIGTEILWSSRDDLSKMTNILKWEFRQYKSEIDSFFNDSYEKLVKLLKSIVVFEEESDYYFVLLRLIQLSLPSYIGQSQLDLGVDFSDIQTLSFEECAFRYYKKYDDNSKEDPALSIFAFFMLHHEKFGKVENIDYFNYLIRTNEIKEFLFDKKEEFDFRIFESNMKKEFKEGEERYSLTDIDLMSGEEFEIFVGEMLSKMGYISKVTKYSGDFGIDVIAEKNGTKIGIQAKRYSHPVSNSAIQEVTAGMKYYECQKGIVVTNSTFTKAAIELARINSIQLWDRNTLEEKILELF